MKRPAPHRASLWLLGGALLVLQVAGLCLQARQSIQGVVAIALLEGAAYLAAVHCVRTLGLASHALTFILVVAAVLRAMTVIMPPYLSSDMYRYVWDGRVQGAGINPYRYVPADEALTTLRDDAIYPNINRSGYARTIYPPAAQMIYFAVTRLSERVTAMKLAMLAFEAVAIVLLIGLLRRSGSPVDQVLIYAWHPLTVWEIAGSGHVDAAMVAFLVLALWARQRRLPVLCGLALAGSTLIKFFPLLLAPALYRRWDWKMPTAFALAVLLLYVPYLSVGWNVLGFLPNYWTEERLASGSGFYLMNLAGWLSGRSDLPSLPYLAAAAVCLARRLADPGRGLRSRRDAALPLVFPVAAAAALPRPLLADAALDLGQLPPLSGPGEPVAFHGAAGQLPAVRAFSDRDRDPSGPPSLAAESAGGASCRQRRAASEITLSDSSAPSARPFSKSPSMRPIWLVTWAKHSTGRPRAAAKA